MTTNTDRDTIPPAFLLHICLLLARCLCGFAGSANRATMDLTWRGDTCPSASRTSNSDKNSTKSDCFEWLYPWRCRRLIDSALAGFFDLLQQNASLEERLGTAAAQSSIGKVQSVNPMRNRKRSEAPRRLKTPGRACREPAFATASCNAEGMIKEPVQGSSLVEE